MTNHSNLNGRAADAGQAAGGLIVGRRVVSAAQSLRTIGWYAIKKAEEQERGSRLEILTSLLMSPLAMEAALNHVGESCFSTAIWKALERSAPRDKLDAIADQLHVVIDMGSEPFQHFTPMFRFRNELAHGKTVVIDGVAPYDPVRDNDPQDTTEFMASWERRWNLETARTWQDSVKGMVNTLCEAADCNNPLFSGTSASWTIHEEDHGEV
ncbi:MAG: hypothetical protein JXA57_20985 [Armatimonadetes bacterium]|nr:hypothetical protein [Armatimonadota bacterium]